MFQKRLKELWCDVQIVMIYHNIQFHRLVSSYTTTNNRVGFLMLHYCGRLLGFPWGTAMTEQSVTYGSWAGSNIRTMKRKFEGKKRKIKERKRNFHTTWILLVVAVERCLCVCACASVCVCALIFFIYFLFFLITNH